MSTNRWEYMKEGDDDNLYDEDGNCRPITTHDFVFPYGKYIGTPLSDIIDTGYLRWAKKNNDDKSCPDWFFNKVMVMRLNELTQ